MMLVALTLRPRLQKLSTHTLFPNIGVPVRASERILKEFLLKSNKYILFIYLFIYLFTAYFILVSWTRKPFLKVDIIFCDEMLNMLMDSIPFLCQSEQDPAKFVNTFRYHLQLCYILLI
jgi:hypothetical protein